MFQFLPKTAAGLSPYAKTVGAQNKSNLLQKNQMYNMSTLQLIQLKMA